MGEEKDNLEVLRLIVYTTLAEDLANDLVSLPNVNISRDVLRHLITATVKLEIWGRVIDKVEVCFPVNWKEAIKERFAPAWFKRRCPVEMKRIRLVAKELYPKMALPEREDGMIHLDRQVRYFKDG